MIRYSGRILMQVGGIAVLTAVGLAGAAVLTRQSALTTAEKDTLDIDRVVAAQVESEFGTILSVLNEAAGKIGNGVARRGTIDADAVNGYLTALKAGLPLVDSLVVADADGVVRAGTRGVPVPSPTVADRPYFPLLRQAVPGAIEVTAPLLNKFSGQQNFLVVRRMDVDGVFAGVVSASVRPEHIGAFFEKVNTVSDAKLSVVRHDGTMLFRVPAGHLGTKVATHWVRENSSFGSTRFTSVLDGIERIAAYRVLPNLPVVVVVSRDLDDVLRSWRTRMAWTGGALLTLLGCVIPLWLFARDQARHRREALEALRESEERLRSILAASPFPILVYSPDDGELLLHNAKAAALFGPDLPVSPLHGDEGFEDPAERQALAATLRDAGVIRDREVRLYNGGHEAFWALVSTVIVRIDGRDMVLTAVNDISARKRFEEDAQSARRAAELALEDLRQAQSRLVQSEKLASLGALVAGVAHEVNTPLGIILAASTHLAETLDRFGARVGKERLTRGAFEAFLRDQREGMQLLVANSHRAADLIQSFKQVAADQTSDIRRHFDLAHWLNDLLFSLSPTWKRTGHQVVAECPPGIEVDGYPGVLSQILSNLVNNSLIHAYADGDSGSIRIGASMADAETVELTYQDDGKGIPQEDLGRLFEPFFTTRRMAGSTGLGLHIVHNLVTGVLLGSMTVTSQLGSGTRFVIRFPRVSPYTAGKGR